MKSNKKIVIFDLDGTILDTICDIAAAVNCALSLYGNPQRSVEEVKSFLGNGSLMLIRRALQNGGDDEFCKEVRTHFRAEYEKRMLEQTVPYDGIAEIVDRLNEKGIISVVLTNKDDKNAVPMIKHYFGDRFALVRGVRADNERKPSPDVALSIIADFGFTPDEALIVGDGMADMQLAKNANIDFLPIGYGYTDPSRLYNECGIAPVLSAEELKTALEEL
ncbi:MAG: HAD hydrolase-like protein [Clostridia bacterium]|nr:HAD hydrolase-like protein [Clostridia bacterium]